MAGEQARPRAAGDVARPVDAPPVLAHRFDGAGASPPLLLLNGGFMSFGAWEPCASLLARHVRVLRCDFRGQLLTPAPAHRDIAANVADVVALLDHLGLPRVHVLGTSFGGLVGLLLSARHPGRVASLVAVTVTDHADEAIRAGSREMDGILREIAAGADPGIFHDVLVRDVYSAAYREANRDLLATRRRQVGFLPPWWFAALDDLLLAIAAVDLRPELGSVECPTLVVVAGDDRVTLPERGRAVAAAVPGARLVEHPTSGHVLIAEHPEWLVEQVLAFLRDAAP